MADRLERLGLRLEPLYRLFSALWLIYAVGIGACAWGSQLISYADPGRYVLTGGAVLVALGMALRLVAPGRPQWTRWSLPVIGGLGVAMFVLVQFGVDLAGGFTVARVGYSLVILVPALTSYVHWVAERVVMPR